VDQQRRHQLADQGFRLSATVHGELQLYASADAQGADLGKTLQLHGVQHRAALGVEQIWAGEDL
jgi:hypothetical protein